MTNSLMMVLFTDTFKCNRRNDSHSSGKNKSGGRKNTLSYEDIRKIVAFFINYAEENALHLPGRMPGYRKDDITLLPSSHSKVSVGVCCLPEGILIGCEKLIQQENHLAQVKEERVLYQKMVGKATVKQLEVNGLQTGAPNSRPVEMHYSFEYAQQVHLPSNPLQPGPIYFFTTHKGGYFAPQKSITLNFLVAGHTKFAPDWCFLAFLVVAGVHEAGFDFHIVMHVYTNHLTLTLKYSDPSKGAVQLVNQHNCMGILQKLILVLLLTLFVCELQAAAIENSGKSDVFVHEMGQLTGRDVY
ncbi:hypothetical protein CAPTEDRAFT_199988 [Capitella teleta]|uniref:Uncharacterized protein n=1 Tax=Capitella teleta TaxID=283909 RepID=R7TF49_CAPTE|nr:hypothetical protein CAPTEDRAFT_199988 [Capitella teleta]|eukprot:ELT92117.1 hypothetical protein CAPTEDRAFT_199988 [Capitella teleta]